jgi:hypothetical protein
VCVCVCVMFLKSFTALTAPGPRAQLQCSGKHRAIARRVAAARGRGGEFVSYIPNLSNFSLPCTEYRQLEFCVQSLLEGLCKREKFQVRFRLNQPLPSESTVVRGRNGKARRRYFLVLVLQGST